MVRYRLLAACYLDGDKHQAGEVIERPHDWKGPTRSVRTDTHKYDQPLGGTHEEKPLYERVDETR